ncbi:MAG: ChbG/HpnK family deacetylase [Chthoniobacterales bacterium]
MLIINADDWGRSSAATEGAAACFQKGRITSTTAMVFMADSERGARIARELKIDVGLHINFSEEFSAAAVSPEVRGAHRAIRRFLKSSRYALLLYNPFLRRQFALVLRAQLEEFERLFERAPSHLDGHQHLHLCSNSLIDRLLPPGTKVRRSFSFRVGEKGLVNRAYRGLIDRALVKRHPVTDYFFALSQNLQTDRLARVVRLAHDHAVELMAHPEVAGEFERLLGDEFAEQIAPVRLGSYQDLG